MIDEREPSVPGQRVEEAKALAELRLADDEGQVHRLGDAWAVRPVVLAFVRHYGCIFCRQRIADLIAHAKEFRGAGAGLAVVGMGSPPFAKAFRAETGYRGALYVDETGAAYEAAGLSRARVHRILRPRVLAAAWRARRQGFRQGKVVGDAFQLGGTFVVTPDDRIVWSWRNAGPEDDAPVAEVLAALRRLPA